MSVGYAKSISMAALFTELCFVFSSLRNWVYKKGCLHAPVILEACLVMSSTMFSIWWKGRKLFMQNLIFTPIFLPFISFTLHVTSFISLLSVNILFPYFVEIRDVCLAFFYYIWCILPRKMGSICSVILIVIWHALMWLVDLWNCFQGCGLLFSAVLQMG